MEKKEFLSEENYQRGKEKLKKIALIILIVGGVLGVSLILTGIIKQTQVNSKYSDESKASIQMQLATEKANLEAKKAELETTKNTSLATEKANLEAKKAEFETKIKPIEDQIKGLEREKTNVFMNGGFSNRYYEIEDKIEELKKSLDADKKSVSIIEDALDTSFDHCKFDAAKNNEYTSKYCSIVNNTDGEASYISAINKALDESFNYCKFDETKNNQYTSKYCSLKLQIEDFDGFNKTFDSAKYIPFYMIGGFIILVSCMIAGAIYMITKRREIIAFSAQQVMPLAQEGIEKIAPTVGKAGASIAKEMAPVYGNIAKEISNGIKEGLKDNNNQE